MSAIDTVVLAIDVQESFRHRDYFREDGIGGFVERQQALIDGAVARGIPVVQVFHVEPEGVFSNASGNVRTLEPIKLQPQAVFHKSRHSALIGSGLDVWLIANAVRRVIVSGIRTEQCCETTTRHLSDMGFNVDFVSEATLTFPMMAAGGREWSAAEIRARTELVLADRFARIATVEQALADRQLVRAA